VTIWRIPRSARARLADPRTPLVLLGLVCVLGVGVRAYRLSTPVAKPPSAGYIFDERYYVSAARIIAGRKVSVGDVYFGAAPSGADPNAEHPQLGKLIIAGSIDVFGDNAIGWRISAVIFGAAAILLLYWLVRCAGGSGWLALGAASLASFENLWVVHSRIAVLDIYAVPFMLAAAAFYLRRRPFVSGALIGIGCCVKEFAAYTVLVLVLFELIRVMGGAIGERTAVLGRRRLLGQALRRLVPLLPMTLVTVVAYFTLLTALDAAVTPYSGGHPVDRNQASICKYMLIWQDSCNHFTFMNHYAAKLQDIGHPRGIATAPTQFWLDRKMITYYGTSRVVSSGGHVQSNQKILWFRGEIGRVLLFTSWLALLFCLWWALRRRDEPALLAVAWALGTWLPPELFHLVDRRTTYLYYMVVTMPALYIAVAKLLGARRLPWLILAAWTIAFLWDFTNLYPFREAISI
jgi:4-amino-4-deoxy-L-arabinose transferase-like glycosyltransferase